MFGAFAVKHSFPVRGYTVKYVDYFFKIIHVYSIQNWFYMVGYDLFYSRYSTRHEENLNQESWEVGAFFF